MMSNGASAPHRIESAVPGDVLDARIAASRRVQAGIAIHRSNRPSVSSCDRMISMHVMRSISSPSGQTEHGVAGSQADDRQRARGCGCIRAGSAPSAVWIVAVRKPALTQPIHVRLPPVPRSCRSAA